MQSSRATRRFSSKGIAIKSHVFGMALLSVIAIVVNAPAEAQNGSLTRSFVSSTGNDGNPCTITQPCATFATAYTKIGANGIIAALDPGKYGPLTIIGPVTINGNGWAAITAPSKGSGIIINASAASGDVVNLNGIEIDGAGAAYSGIVFNSGGPLTVSNCLVENFLFNSGDNNNPNLTGNGIMLAPETGNTFFFDINNTVVATSRQNGILYIPPSGVSPTAFINIDHVAAKGNFEGIRLDVQFAGTGSVTNATVSNSILSNNSFAGIQLVPSITNMTVSIDSTVINNNGFYGISASGSGHYLLGRSVITGNGFDSGRNDGFGVGNSTGSGGNNTFFSYQNNQINGNRVDVASGSVYEPLVVIPTQ
jgi:hypothetical protein